jgi:hypothetical protein
MGGAAAAGGWLVEGADSASSCSSRWRKSTGLAAACLGDGALPFCTAATRCMGSRPKAAGGGIGRPGKWPFWLAAFSLAARETTVRGARLGFRGARAAQQAKTPG